MTRTSVAPEPFDAVEPDWDDLAGATRAMPFVRPGWIRGWLDAFGGGEPELLTARRDGRLVGVLPLVRRRGVLHSPTNWESPGFEAVAADAEARRAVLDAAFARARHGLTLEFVDGSGADVEEARAAAGRSGFRFVERTLERPPYVAIEGDYESWARDRLGSKLLADLRRRRRKLEGEGTVDVVVEDGTERLDELLEIGYRLEGSGWKTAQRTAIAVRPQARRFYDLIGRWAADRGILRLAFLRLDGRPLAFQYGIEEHGVYYFCKGGIDPGAHRYAPGKLLVAELLQRSFEQGLESFEFLGEAEAWKREWTDELRERRVFQSFGRTPLGLAGLAAERYGRPLAKRLRLKQAVARLRGR